jgi:zinc transporter ZupT
MQLIQFALSSYFIKSHKRVAGREFDSEVEDPALNLHVDQNCLHIHEHDKAEGEDKTVSSLKSQETKFQKRSSVALLEAGIAIHSVIIGFALGVSSGSEFIALLIALCFHQFFEGMS